MFQTDSIQPDFIQEFAQQPPVTIFQTDFVQSDFVQEFAGLPYVGWECILPDLQILIRTRAAAGALKGKSGFAAFPQPFPEGWQVQLPQPPFQPTILKRTGALSHPEEGIEGRFIPPVVTTSVNWSFDIQQTISKINYNQRGSATKGKADFAIYSNWVNGGWEIQSVQPPTFPKTNQKTGALSHPEEGIEFPFIPPVVTVTVNWSFDIQQPLLKINYRSGAWSQKEDGIEAPYINFHPYGWEIPSPQPPHLKPEKAGSVLRGDDGTEGILTRFLPFSFEIQPPQPPFRISQNRGTILKGDDGTEGIFINFFPSGWEIQPPQPPHTFFEKKGAILRGIDGIEGIFINFFPAGWEIQPYQPPFYPKTSQKTGALSHPEEGIEAPYVFVPSTQPIWGFDIQPSPSRLYYRGGAWSKWEDGIEFPLVNFFPAGWEVQPVQPPFSLTTKQKIAALSQWEDGIEAKFIFVAPGQIVDGWEVQAFQPPFYPKTNQKLGSVSQWEDGIEYPFSNWKNMGWEIQPVQPPHNFVEKRGLFLRGDDGIEYILVRFFPSGWEIQPPQPPFFPTIVGRYGALSHPEEGIEFPFIFVARNVDLNPVGWIIQLPQPPHPRPEKSGAWMFGDSGIEGVFKFVPPTKKNFEFLIKWRRRGRR